MKKIYYIANVRIPTEKAHGLQIMKMCEAFAMVGANVELVVPTRINPQFQKVNPFSFYSVSNNFVIKKIFSFDPKFLIKLRSGHYIKVQSLFFVFGLFFYLIARKLNKKTDVIYTRDHYLLWFLQYFSFNLVLEIHNMPSDPKKYLKYWVKCSNIIAISNGLKNELAQVGVPIDKIIVAPDAVNLKDFLIADDKKLFREKLKLPLDKKIVMYTGHLYDWKGAEILAEAATSFDDNTIAVFVGGTDSDIERFKSRFGDNNKIIIVGRVDHKLIPYYLKAADVLALPNSAKSKISKFYTSPMKLFEYMASGRPIIASDLPSIREVVNEDFVVFFEPDNSIDLSKKISDLLLDKSNTYDLVYKSFNEVKKYTWDLRAKNILESFYIE